MIFDPHIILNQILPKIITTSISFSVVALFTMAIYYFFFKKLHRIKYQKIVKKRLIYLMLILDLLILTKIWVDGFSHIITVLSLMAAGLVVANKESVMNLIGGMIINWRDLFVEGDFIQIQHFSGYVFSIGIMYFKLYETASINEKNATGRTIKVPNSLVITAPLINFSPDSDLCLHKIYLDCDKGQALAQQLDKILLLIQSIFKDYSDNNPRYQKAYIKSHNRELSRLIKVGPSVSLEQYVDKELYLRIVVRFYCFSDDYDSIVQRFWLGIYS